MGESNKILSVTYGTFSCRLEGFDDSVETMKTVVSYFHELAGHDRFMDMDPQAPDLDELAELTAEDSGMQVAADDIAGQVSLRVQQPAPQADERPSLRIRRPETETPSEPDIADQAMDAPQFADGDDSDLIATNDDISDLDDLSEMNDDISDLDDPSDLDDISDLDDLADLEALDQEDETAFAEDSQEETAIEADVTVSASLDDEDTDEILAVTMPDDIQPDHAAQEDVGIDTEEAPVAAQDADVTQEDVAQEPETPDAPFYDPAAATEEESGDSVAAKLERIRALVGRVPPPNRPEPSKTPDPTKVGSIVDRLSALTGAAPEEEAQQTEDLVDDFDFKSDSAQPLVLSHEDEADDPALDDQAENAVDDGFDPEGAPDAPEPVMSDDAQDVLDDTPDEADMPADAQDPPAKEVHSKRNTLPEQNDSEMSRIMSQADERLNEPEGRRHRDAFAQLKAAVAATEAARQLGDQETQADPRDAFKQDLNDAQRTTGEDATGATTEDDAPAEPSPLRLVAENRIEQEEAAAPADTADRLRQIAAVKEPAETSGEGFAEFAAAQGATELSDLLEAAAAYIAYVEGDDDFSRPQVMKKVQMAAADQFSREDGLRSFGRLLRQSRIIKLNNGRFQVSEDTRFRPSGREAQG